MPIKIVPINKKKKKDPFRADKTESLNKKFSRGVSDANKKAMKNVKKKADGGAMNIGKGRNKKPMNMKSPKPKEMPRGRSKKPSKPRGAMPFIMPKQQEMMERMLGKGKPMEAKVGGSLKSVPEGNKGKGLSKLPTEVRNKMGYMKKGGKVMKMRGGGAATRGINYKVM